MEEKSARIYKPDVKGAFGRRKFWAFKSSPVRANNLIADTVTVKGQNLSHTLASKLTVARVYDVIDKDILTHPNEIDPMQQKIEQYAFSFKQKVTDLLHYELDPKAVTFKQGTILSFTKIKSQEDVPADLKISHKKTFEDACRVIDFPIKRFIDPEEIKKQKSDYSLFRGTKIFFTENSFFVLKGNSENLFEDDVIEKDVHEIASFFELVPA